MKEIKSENFTYSQKDIVIGDKKRNVIIINKKPNVKLGQKKVNSTKLIKNNSITVKKRGCSGCSRRRKG